MTLSTKEISPSHRRRVFRLGAGFGLGALLAACGGGGGGDDTAGQERKLQEAYQRVEAGMIWTDVEALVGFPANDERNEYYLKWRIGMTYLSVNFRSGITDHPIADANLKIGDAPMTTRNF
jgi:hypothetical protein